MTDRGMGATPMAADGPRLQSAVSSFQMFTRADWAALRPEGDLPISDHDLQTRCGLNDTVSPQEAADTYLPLARLVDLHIKAARNLDDTLRDSAFTPAAAPRPFVIGIAGSVAVGKSTFARLLQAVLPYGSEKAKVALVATDGFLYPNDVLADLGLMRRKGYPESYDLRRMLAFLVALKAGQPRLRVPVYSHKTYDIVPDEFQDVDTPDVVIFEGLNVLQTGSRPVVASDYFNLSIFLDADAAHIEQWYVDRFLLLQKTAFQDPQSYFHRYKDLRPQEAREFALEVWRDINLPNLRLNIEPTRQRADLIFQKDAFHALSSVWLRRS